MNNLFLIIGEDPKQNDITLKKILNKIDFQEESKIEYNLLENTITDIIDEASMISILSPVKVIIGTNFDVTKITDDEYEYLSKYLNNPNNNVYLILITDKVDARLKNYKLLKEYFNITETSKLDSKDELIGYIKNIIKGKKYTMNDATIEYLLEKTGNDINNIESELLKLMIYKDDKIITIPDIDLLVIDNIDNVIYEFTNAILDDDYDVITSMYNNFKIENISPDYLIASISNVFRQALIIKILNQEGKSNYEIASSIGKKEYYVKKMLERLYKYHIEDITKYIAKLANIDKKYKTGMIYDDELIFFLLNKDK